MTDFVTNITTGQAVPAAGQALAVFPAGLTVGATFTAGSAAAGLNSSVANSGGAVVKTYAAVNTGAAALTAGAIQMQGSDDNVNWFNTGAVLTITTLAAGANVTVQTDTQPWKYTRAQVATTITTAGAATVTVYVIV